LIFFLNFQKVDKIVLEIVYKLLSIANWDLTGKTRIEMKDIQKKN